MDLSIVIPTRNRRAILTETLDRLEMQAREVPCEVIVVDDGSTDDTVELLARRAAETTLPLTLIENEHGGPAAARNRAIAAARAPVCLFIDDDKWPTPGLLARHRDFHARAPEREAALLGHVELPAEPAPSRFMRWLAPAQLGFARIDDPRHAGGRSFFTANVSVKTEFVREAGGFDEEFTSYGHEDIDLGMRLEARGMRLAYDMRAVVEHYHPTDLMRTLVRMGEAGRSLSHFAERHPGRAVPRRPGLRHRAKAAALTGLALARVRTPRVQHETWRFLCHEAHREAYWDTVDGRVRYGDPPGAPIRIGKTLARLASRDPDARWPHARLEGERMQELREAAGVSGAS